MRLDDAAQVLEVAEFFTICSAEQKRMLAFASERIALRKDEVLFRKGDVPRGAYVLMSGTLVSEGDRGELTEVNEAGTMVAELALLTKHPRRANVKAKENCEVLLVPRDSFQKLVQQFPEVAEKAMARIRRDLEGFVRPISGLGQRMKR